MKKVAIYVRVSTQEQAVEGYSISEQIDRLTKFCEAHSWKIYKVYTDPGFSGGSKIRLPSSCSMPLCKGSKPAQYSIREIFFIRLVSSCAILFASKVVEKL